MQKEAIEIIAIPVIQWGFAGFCVIQFAYIVWLTIKLMAVIKENNAVISRNTTMVSKALDAIDKQSEAVAEMHRALIARPCIAGRTE